MTVAASDTRRTSMVNLRNNSKLRNIYGPKCPITLLSEDVYNQPRPKSGKKGSNIAVEEHPPLRPFSGTIATREASPSSSSTPTVPYSTADILYGNEVRQSPQVDDIRQNSFIDYNPKDRERLGSRDLSDQSGRRPGSKGGSRKSLSIEKVSFGKESEDNLRPILPSTKQTNHYRPNGLRSSLLKGEPLFSSRSHTSGKDADDLIAMGTIWSPGAQPQSQPPQKNLSGPSQTTNGPGKTITVGTGSNSSTTLSQTRKYGSNVKPIMVQNAPASGMKNNVKDGKLDPKYTDPLVGAPASFQQRLMELSALEAETVRYERSKKVKKKVKQDRDS
ncbi:uncharacterized protein LOC110442007 isoform X6 [Mizuhopecten yessoensis]|uniref:uncharacterized protein LOC110442007 isoform X6 n=1 Tax=Mizuhopecten yessoensis TaxID=6573 RepID=UPI000B457160|nr:uncharacterized protein LOC110442007 isoform X6 [Mizuhopecten yessoensis]